VTTPARTLLEENKRAAAATIAAVAAVAAAIAQLLGVPPVVAAVAAAVAQLPRNQLQPELRHNLAKGQKSISAALSPQQISVWEIF
jgi:Kef-type K+ transport system membrane component KefB